MAARKNKLTLDESWRERIRAGVLADRLMKHYMGEIELTATQIKAGEILLRKIIPDLARQELTGKDGDPIKTQASIAPDDKKLVSEWLKQQGVIK